MEIRRPATNILLAEDDADDRMLIMRALQQTGGADQVDAVCDGVELMDYLHGAGPYAESAPVQRPSLILLDLNMPLKSGREALREIKADPELRLIPVVILTTSSSPTDIQESYEVGANAYCTKPVKYAELVSLIESVVHFWGKSVAPPVATQA